MFKWANSGVKKMDWLDIKLIKLSTAAFILLLAKFWNVLLSFDWYWYVGIAFLALLRPLKKAFSK